MLYRRLPALVGRSLGYVPLCGGSLALSARLLTSRNKLGEGGALEVVAWQALCESLYPAALMSSCSASSALKPEMFSTLSLDFVEALLSVTWCFLRPSMLATNSVIAWFASPSRAGALIDTPTLSLSRKMPQACKSHRLVPPVCIKIRCERSALIPSNQGSASVTFAPGLARTARLQPSPAVFKYGGSGLVSAGVFVSLKQLLFFMCAQVTCTRKQAWLCRANIRACGGLIIMKRRSCILI